MISPFDDPVVGLEPDCDPFADELVPCVWCGMSAQVSGSGVCSRECWVELHGWYAL